MKFKVLKLLRNGRTFCACGYVSDAVTFRADEGIGPYGMRGQRYHTLSKVLTMSFSGAGVRRETTTMAMQLTTKAGSSS